jgi:hypothetical protein
MRGRELSQVIPSPVLPMMRSIRARSSCRVVALTALGVPLAGASLAAQETAPAQIPIRTLGQAEARSSVSLGGVTQLRALPDGRVFVNDGPRRQVLLFDAALRTERVVADTLEAAIPYGTRNFGVMPYVADSTLLVDPATLSMLVLNSKGELVRVMAAPRSNDLNFLASANLGTHAFDSEGRLIYRLNQPGGMGGGPGGFGGGMMMGGPMMGMFGGGQGGGRGGQGGGPPGGGQQGGQQGRGAPQQTEQQRNAQQIRNQVNAAREDRFPGGGGANTATIMVGGERRTRSFTDRNMPDSTPILRANFDTRKVDTVAFMRVTNTQVEMKTGEDGSMQVTAKMNPLPQNDDWALMKDGSVAVVRVLDYRIDWYTPAGELERSAPLPFDWKRITDDEKEKMVDSLKTAAREASERIAQMMAGGGGGRGFRPSFEPVDAEFLPDYYPPIRAGTTLADYDGNLWLLPATSSLAGQMAAMIPPGAQGRIPAGMLPPGMAAPTGGLAYDVVNRKGELVERVQLPAGRSIAGFGPDGIVYLTAREGREVFLEKVRRPTAP